MLGKVEPSAALASGPFLPATLISELSSTIGEDQDPSLTADELELYFASSRQSTLDIWSATRESLVSPWREPALVNEVSTDCIEQSPEISADGLQLYVANDCPAPAGEVGSFHLWLYERSTRTSTWGSPVAVSNPVPGEGEISPSLDGSGLFLAFASPVPQSGYDLFLTERATRSSPWTTPAPLATLNSSSSDWDPALFAGGRQLVFASQRFDNGDLFHAQRANTKESFGAPSELSELNSSAADGDPWVSADGRRIYFFSKRSGGNHLYFSHR